jgi:molybdopterin molybdotransferase
MLSIPEAFEMMMASFAPLGSEDVSLLQAVGRVAASDVTARFDLPGFDHSAMDGYAVRLAAVRSGVSLPVTNEIRAGGRPQPLGPTGIARIFTGAPLPPDADTVVIQEHAQLAGGGVTFTALPAQGANVRTRGYDYKRGDRIVGTGTWLGPGEIALLAAQGCSHVAVYRRPRVAILPTGDELRPLNAPFEPYTIVDSNTYGLAAAIEQAGCLAEPLPVARDRLDELRERLRVGLQADVLLTIGGVSVGEYDLVGQALRDAGVRIGFHKLAIKPGKPLLFGQHGQRPVIGLPGNPVSALVVFEVFVRPCLQRMLGHAQPYPELLDVVLGDDYRHAHGRTEFVRAHLERHGAGWLARLHPRQDSGAMSSLLGQAALVVLPGGIEQFAAGARLQALVQGLPRRASCPYLVF